MGSYEKFRGEWANANSVKTSLIVNIYLKTLNCTYGVQKNNFFNISICNMHSLVNIAVLSLV